MADYQFRYAPLTGRLTGKQMIEQTEQAFNGLANLVDDAAGQVNVLSTLANEASENAATALEVANEALATTGRTYITVSIQADANDYYDSQLIYIADSTSTNIPVADTGMLEVKTNDNKTACEQVFIADSSGDAYYRNGAITAETVGDVTTYSVTWGGWSSQPASQTYVQNELAGYAPLASLGDYLPLSGGTMTGTIAINGYNPIYSVNNNDGIFIFAGNGDNFRGSTLQLFGREHASYAGQFYLRASTKTSASDTDASHKECVLYGSPAGVLRWGGHDVATDKWTTADLTPTVSYTLASWGFCKIIYNENIAIVTISGLKLSNTYTSPQTIFNLPVSVVDYLAGFLHIDATARVCTCTASGTTFQINGYTTANSNIYGSMILPIS